MRRGDLRGQGEVGAVRGLVGALAGAQVALVVAALGGLHLWRVRTRVEGGGEGGGWEAMRR